MHVAGHGQAYVPGMEPGYLRQIRKATQLACRPSGNGRAQEERTLDGGTDRIRRRGRHGATIFHADEMDSGTYDAMGLSIAYILNDFGSYIGWFSVTVAAGAVAWMSLRERVLPLWIGQSAASRCWRCTASSG